MNEIDQEQCFRGIERRISVRIKGELYKTGVRTVVCGLREISVELQLLLRREKEGEFGASKKAGGRERPVETARPKRFIDVVTETMK